MVVWLCTLIVGCGVEPMPGEEIGVGLPAETSGASQFTRGALEPEIAPELPTDSPAYVRAKAERMRLARTGRANLEPSPGLSVEMFHASSGVPQVANAIIQAPGCLERNLSRNDDNSTSRIPLPFSITFFGTTHDGLYINNNGNVTFNARLRTYTPFTIDARTPPIIAPFFADVDTRNAASGIVTYSASPINFEGRLAFCVNWVNVGYYYNHADKRNSFQLLLVDRRDTGSGNFDIVMNYNTILWETGDASGGSGGYGGTPAGAGFSAGNGDPAAFFQFPGSLVSGGFLDSNPITGLSRTSRMSTVVGRHIFAVRNGTPVVDELISVSPASATRENGQTHTLTATLVNASGQPIPGRAVTFTIVSGPNSSIPPATVNTDSTGRALFSYIGSHGAGRDFIRAWFVRSSGQVRYSDPVSVDWLVTDRPPIALCRDVVVPAGETCSVAASIDNGSHDPDGDLVGCTQSPDPVHGAGPTPVTLTCQDARGNTASCTATVTVVDTTAPAITCPADRVAECVAGAATVTLGPASASDNCTSVSVSDPGTASYPLGSTPVTYTATDPSGNSSTCTAQVTVADTLAPSVSLNGSESQVLECGVDTYTEAGATASDLCAGDVSSTVAIVGSVDTGSTGVYNLAYTATDPAGHVSQPTFRTVTVVDTTPPEVTVGPAVQIWPPNHRMRSFRLSDCAITADACGGSVDIDALGTITSIYSDEPEDAAGNGDGHTTGDIVITGNATFALRAERQGCGNGRVYGVSFTVADGSGNTRSATCHFAVPHDQSGTPAVDDGAGAGYTVSASSTSLAVRSR